MQSQDPAFLYVILILPSLFALTLIAEGLHKILKKESGWINFFLGIVFLFIVIFAYFNVLK